MVVQKVAGSVETWVALWGSHSAGYWADCSAALLETQTAVVRGRLLVEYSAVH